MNVCSYIFNTLTLFAIAFSKTIKIIKRCISCLNEMITQKHAQHNQAFHGNYLNFIPREVGLAQYSRWKVNILASIIDQLIATFIWKKFFRC
jgi:hypothetical protein